MSGFKLFQCMNLMIVGRVWDDQVALHGKYSDSGILDHTSLISPDISACPSPKVCLPIYCIHITILQHIGKCHKMYTKINVNISC